MWFQKSELRKQIDKYDRDKDILLEFAGSVHKPWIEEITLENIKEYYTAIIAPKNSLFDRNKHMLAVRKFFKHYRGENILDWQSVTDDPLKSVDIIGMIDPMKKITEKKRGVGRPRDIANIKKAIVMRKEGIAFRTIALALGKDASQIFVWWRDREKLLS